MTDSRRYLPLPLLFLLTALLIACAPQHDDNQDDDSSPDQQTPDDDSAVDDDSGNDDSSPDDDNDSADDDTEYNVIEQEDIGADWDCWWPQVCIRDYFTFLDLAAPYADPITKNQLTQEISDVEQGLVPPLTDPLSEEELNETVTEILNIGFLRTDINARLLTVTTVGQLETDSYYEKDLLFEDPYVGTFKGILLLPKTGGPFPAVVAIHGHRTSARLYRDFYHGHDYPAHGYAILMLTMRAMGLDIFEHEVAKNFLLDGFALMGLRSYETLLGLKYLRYLPQIIDDRIGLIGHSGGSSTSNLTIRMEQGFAAYVSDMTHDYCEWGTWWEPYHCETIPELFPYHLLINDFATSSVPVKQVPYGYANGMPEIFNFFDQYLKD